MTQSVPKAILYYSPMSIWAACVGLIVPGTALLALDEKGYGEDEVDLKEVDISKAENLSMQFLRLNKNGTVPTLVAPMEKTLGPEDDHRFRSITDTKKILEFLDKSRSSMSRTHTTSSAPAPSLTPATIALSTTASSIIDLLHSPIADPNLLFYYTYISPTQLAKSAQTMVGFLSGRRDALKSFIEQSNAAEIKASDNTRKLWEAKKKQAEELLAVYSVAGKEGSQLTPEEKTVRESFIATANDLWTVKLKNVLITLDKELIGPFALGDQVSLVDLHLAPWLARIASLCDGLPTDSGDAIVAKLETRIGDDFILPRDFTSNATPAGVIADPALEITPGAKRAKLAAFWDEMKGRESWRKIYGERLF